MNEGRSKFKPFPTTQWSLIVRAGGSDPVERHQALSEICTLYWLPVYAFIRSRGHIPADAEDLTQGLFAELIERNDFAKADASRGKLRSYLLTAAKNHLAGEHRKIRAHKRGGQTITLSIDTGTAESRCYVPEPVDEFTPEKAFQRQWAITIMENVVNELSATYARKGRSELFSALRPFIQVELEPTSQGALASRLGMSDQALRVAIHRLRQRYAETFRRIVRSTLGPNENIDEELAALLSSF
jgi:RNA polymerase sigma factor (sigma-70 family)